MYPPIATERGTTQVVVNLKFNKPLLKKGSRKEEVRELRKLLAHWNVFTSADSDIFDLSLEKAVKAFQRRVFLDEDGVVGPQTWQALYVGAPVTMPELRQGCCGQAVELLQSALGATGTCHIKVDGIFGPLTEGAVRDFQRRQGLVVDGVVGCSTWRVLSKLPR